MDVTMILGVAMSSLCIASSTGSHAVLHALQELGLTSAQNDLFHGASCYWLALISCMLCIASMTHLHFFSRPALSVYKLSNWHKGKAVRTMIVP